MEYFQVKHEKHEEHPCWALYLLLVQIKHIQLQEVNNVTIKGKIPL